MYSQETLDRMSKDQKKWRDDLTAAKLQVAKVLSELDEAQCRNLLQSMLTYGWRRPDGMWMPSPVGQYREYQLWAPYETGD